ncbi:hypothetical protein SCOR_05730 [Sulfidibacter corallicola]
METATPFRFCGNPVSPEELDLIKEMAEEFWRPGKGGLAERNWPKRSVSCLIGNDPAVD